MRSNSKRKKVFVLIYICILAVPSVLLFKTGDELKQVRYNFNIYKKEAESAIREKENKIMELEEELNFTKSDYDMDDMDYGSCGTAPSGTFLNMVVDWREDSVYNPKEKTAYLTFDDGPSQRTSEILDILDQYGIKATFFVVGTRDKESQSLYKEIVDRGHTLGMHSQSHNYDKIYASTEDFLADFNEIFTTIKDKTNSTPVLFRFPGGSNNPRMVKNNTEEDIKKEMAVRGFVYYDWNVSAEDAVYSNVAPDSIVNNVLEGSRNKHRAVILLHDSGAKESTVAALPQIIEGLKKQGFVFDKLESDLVPIQFQ